VHHALLVRHPANRSVELSTATTDATGAMAVTGRDATGVAAAALPSLVTGVALIVSGRRRPCLPDGSSSGRTGLATAVVIVPVAAAALVRSASPLLHVSVSLMLALLDPSVNRQPAGRAR
jgi:hypothetical protein